MAAPTSFKVKWSTTSLDLEFVEGATVGDLRLKLHQLFGVQPRHQKLMGLAKGIVAPGDGVLLESLKLKRNKTVTMIGTPDADLDAARAAVVTDPELLDDWEQSDEALAIHRIPENIEKVRARAESITVNVLSPPRPGKKLLVLDIDYTLYDHKSTAEHFDALTRPHLHEFMARAYKHYDICIWSATSLKWIELKLTEMGIAADGRYEVAFALDSRAMISVLTSSGLVNVKPLGVIWEKFPGIYGPNNTIMIDDVRRNFLMNPSNGLRIKPCRQLPTNRDDAELLRLATYLETIASLDDEAFGVLEHPHGTSR